MKNKKGLFVKKENYDEVTRLLRDKNIRHTSMLGIFHFDLISFMIGFVAAAAFVIIVF